VVGRRAAALAALLVCSALAPPPKEHASSGADRTALGVTIYNQDVAVVRDRRVVTIPSGTSLLALEDVANAMLPETVALRDARGDAAFDVVEQNFEAAVLTPAALLQANVGHEVTTERRGDGPVRREHAILLAANGGAVLRYRDRIETADSDQIVFAPAARGLRPHATLVATLNAPRTSRREVEMTYLTHGLSWRAVYVGMLAPAADRLELHGDAVIDNRSGASYERAKVQLVAGDINVARNPRAPGPPLTVIASVRARPLFQEDLFSYHLYTMPRAVTIADAQTKRFALLDARSIPLATTLEVRGGSEVGVYVSFQNRGGELGIPLPAGQMRIYQRDAGGTAQYVGQSTLEHTPRNATVRFRLGRAADLSVRRIAVADRAVPGGREREVRITLINGRDSARSVRVVEPLFGDWDIVSSTQPYLKTSATTATWDLRVPPDGSIDLVYRVRFRA